MKTQKMSLANAQGKLSRKEMKTIMAGSYSGSSNCKTNIQCGNNGEGKCGAVESGCWCLVGSQGKPDSNCV